MAQEVTVIDQNNPGASPADSRVPSQKKGDSFLEKELGEYEEAQKDLREARAKWEEAETKKNNNASDFLLLLGRNQFKDGETIKRRDTVEKVIEPGGLFKKRQTFKEEKIVVEVALTRRYRKITEDSQVSKLHRELKKAERRVTDSGSRINIFRGHGPGY